ncbi:MAG: DUF4190 domain-containing protein [Saprospiraceae bacterium]|nr:DUF4190 domain-containing protein [Saprospiraceae bacterium]
MAILGFSISVASLLLGINLFIFLSIFGGLLGILFSSIALKRIKRQRVPRKGKGLAVAGLVTGIVVAGAWLIFILGFLLAFA